MVVANIIENLRSNQHVLIVCNSGNYPKLIEDLTKGAQEKFSMICMVAASKTSDTLLSEFQQNGLDCDKFIFIDFVAGEGEQPKYSERCLYMPDPRDLDILMTLLPNMIDHKKIELIILDNISSLLIYNDPLTLTRFLHGMVTKLRDTNSKSIYIVMKKDFTGVIQDLELFIDSIIEY